MRSPCFCYNHLLQSYASLETLCGSLVSPCLILFLQQRLHFHHGHPSPLMCRLVLLQELAQTHTVLLHYVKAHSGILGNEIADEHPPEATPTSLVFISLSSKKNMFASLSSTFANRGMFIGETLATKLSRDCFWPSSGLLLPLHCPSTLAPALSTTLYFAFVFDIRV